MFTFAQWGPGWSPETSPRRPPPKPESPIVILETQDSQAHASRVAAREVEGPGPAWGVPSLSLFGANASHGEPLRVLPVGTSVSH